MLRRLASACVGNERDGEAIVRLRGGGEFEGQTGLREGAWWVQERRWTDHAVWQLLLLFIGHSRTRMSVASAAYACSCEMCVDRRTVGVDV